MSLDAYLEPLVDRLRIDGLLRDPADASARRRLLAGSAAHDAETGATNESGERRGVDATSNDYLGLASQLVDVSRETSMHDEATFLAGLDVEAPKDMPGTAGVGTRLAERGTHLAERDQGSPAGAAQTAQPPKVDRGTVVPVTGGWLRTHARAGAGAARLVQGTWPEHEALERELATWVGAESALLFSSGFAANSGTIAALAGADSVIFSDQLNHASIVDGCRLARGETVVVPHLDLGALESSLRGSATFRSRWVVTESYFSMDGDGPNLSELRALCDRYDAFLVVDEAHGLGVFGPRGAGRCAEAGIRPDVFVGTLGKAVGTEGAFVAGSHTLRTWLWNRARTFVFSTAPSPATCSLTLRHVKQAIDSDARRARLHAHGVELRRRLRDAGVPLVAGSFGPIVSVLAGSNEAALALAERVRAAGILVQPIRPPTVPPGHARLRVTLSAAHSPTDIASIADAVMRAWTAVVR